MSNQGTGGIKAKLEAIRLANSWGINCWIAGSSISLLKIVECLDSGIYPEEYIGTRFLHD